MSNMEKRHRTRDSNLLYPNPLVILREHQMGSIISWWIQKYFWAELDLNQRRHIANEFTVRPH
nr:hypothetical protein 59 - garden pea chloroplast [Pisum sativum]